MIKFVACRDIKHSMARRDIKHGVDHRNGNHEKKGLEGKMQVLANGS